MRFQFSQRDRTWAIAESKGGIRQESLENWEEGTQHAARKMGAEWTKEISLIGGE